MQSRAAAASSERASANSHGRLCRAPTSIPKGTDAIKQAAAAAAGSRLWNGPIMAGQFAADSSQIFVTAFT